MFTAWSSATKLRVATLRPGWHCWRFSTGFLLVPFQWERAFVSPEVTPDSGPAPLVRWERRLLEAGLVECLVYRGRRACWPSAHRPAERALSSVLVEPNPAAVPEYSGGVGGHVVTIGAIALRGENGLAVGFRIPVWMEAIPAQGSETHVLLERR